MTLGRMRRWWRGYGRYASIAVASILLSVGVAAWLAGRSSPPRVRGVLGVPVVVRAGGAPACVPASKDVRISSGTRGGLRYWQDTRDVRRLLWGDSETRGKFACVEAGLFVAAGTYELDGITNLEPFVGLSVQVRPNPMLSIGVALLLLGLTGALPLWFLIRRARRSISHLAVESTGPADRRSGLAPSKAGRRSGLAPLKAGRRSGLAPLKSLISLKNGEVPGSVLALARVVRVPMLVSADAPLRLELGVPVSIAHTVILPVSSWDAPRFQAALEDPQVDAQDAWTWLFASCAATVARLDGDTSGSVTDHGPSSIADCA